MRVLVLAVVLLMGASQCMGSSLPSPAPSSGSTSWTPTASNWQCPTPPAATFVGSDNPLTGWDGTCTLASGEVCSGSAGPTGFHGTCTGGTGAAPVGGVEGASTAPVASSGPVATCGFTRRLSAGSRQRGNEGCSNGLTPSPANGASSAPGGNCGGGGTSSQATGSYYTPGPADVCVASAPAPAPFNPSNLTGLGIISLPNQLSTTAASVTRRTNAFTVTATNGHEAAELIFDLGNGSSYTAALAAETAYEELQRPLVSQGTTGLIQAYAPTFLFGCFENSTYYRGDGSAAGTNAYFTVFAWCNAKHGFVYQTPINANFLMQYVRVNPVNNLPSYTTEIFTTNSTVSNPSTWYSLLYNYQTSRWDIVESGPSDAGLVAHGWSLDEGYFAPGPCPIEAPIAASGISVYNLTTSTWELLQPTMANGLTSDANTIDTPYECFSASINVKVLTANSSWIAVSRPPYIAP